MKRNVITLGLVTALLLSLLATTFAVQDYEVIFDKRFIQSNHLNSHGLRSVVFENDVFYAYLENTIYIWKEGDLQPVQYCILPQPPKWNVAWRSTPLQQLPSEERAQLEQSVDYIAGGDGALWGYNLISGKIGKINENGIIWNDQPLNTTTHFFKNGMVALYFIPIQSFVDDGYLYMFGDNDGIKELGSAKPLLRFDLGSGEYTVMDSKQARNICAYKPGSVLLAQKGDSKSMTLSVMNLKTGDIEALPLTIPFPDRSDAYLSCIGGLAYNAKGDDIYFVFGETPFACDVWQSKGGQPFRAVMRLDAHAHSNVLAWTMLHGQYAFFNVEGLHICSLE